MSNILLPHYHAGVVAQPSWTPENIGLSVDLHCG